MKCQFCKTEIANDSLFCTACGKKQDKKINAAESQVKFCISCGAKINAGAMFCTSCGAKIYTDNPGISNNTPMQSTSKLHNTAPASSAFNSQNTAKQIPIPKAVEPEKISANDISQVFDGISFADTLPVAPEIKSDNSIKIAAIIVLSVLLVAVIAVGTIFTISKINNKDKNNTEANNTEYVNSDDKTEEAESTEDVFADSTQEQSKVADYNLDNMSTITLDGNFSVDTGGNYVLTWQDPKSFSKQGSYYEGITQAYLFYNDCYLQEYINQGEMINVTGEVNLFDDTNISINVDTIRNSENRDIADLVAESNSGDYIIPDSDTRKLTTEDIEDLSLRELNYAKNEIYARHGRKFDSPELRAFFESKSWYKGTIDPSDFSDNVLNQAERANVYLIKEMEYSINPNGYQLDQ